MAYDKKPPSPASAGYTQPKMASAPATRPMAPDTKGHPNALPKHAMHPRGRNRGLGKC